MGRPVTVNIVNKPDGYPYILYQADKELFLATSASEAKKKAKIIRVANINELISANGHSKTNHILKNIGDNWICKEGKIFFGL